MKAEGFILSLLVTLCFLIIHKEIKRKGFLQITISKKPQV